MLIALGVGAVGYLIAVSVWITVNAWIVVLGL